MTNHLIDPGQYNAICMEQGMARSAKVDLSSIPEGNLTPIFKMGIVYSPEPYGVTRLFDGRDYDAYILNIILHPGTTAALRHTDMYGLKAQIEYLQDNAVTLVAPAARSEQNNPAALLVGSNDFDLLTDTLIENNTLGRKATSALQKLKQEIWPEFKEKTQAMRLVQV